MDFIFGRSSLCCRESYHKGSTCGQFLWAKFKRQATNAIRLQLLFIILPALIMSHKKLRQNPKREGAKVLNKFIRATLFVLTSCVVPWICCCTLSKAGVLIPNRAIMVTGHLLSCLCVCIEKPARHEQYVGFLLPRIVGTLWTAQTIRHGIKDSPTIRSFLQVALFCGLIGLAHKRGHYN